MNRDNSIQSKADARRSSIKSVTAAPLPVATTARRDIQVVSTNLTATAAQRPDREQLVAEAAYHRAESRGFEAGQELEDWLSAEAEVDSRMLGEGRAY